MRFDGISLAHEITQPSGAIQALKGLLLLRVVHVRLFLDGKIPFRSGPFDTLVLEITVDSLAAWEKTRAKMFSSSEFAEAMESSPSMSYQSGRTEFSTIEAEG